MAARRAAAALIGALLLLVVAASASEDVDVLHARERAVLARAFENDVRGGTLRAPNASLYVTARDGVRLWTLVFLPPGASADAPVGAVLMRTPYGVEENSDRSVTWPERGFAYVEQDQRGSGRSAVDDTFKLWRSDGPDGYDTMAWIAAQPWSNGRVFMQGSSAAGNAAFAASVAAPPWLRVLFPTVATAHGHKTIYQGGAYREGMLKPWLEGHDFEYLIPEVLAHEAEDEYWEPLRLPGREEVCTYPGVHSTGWYDVFMNEGIDGFEALQYNAPDPRCRGQHYLVVEPGGHCDRGDYAWPDPKTNLATMLAQYLYFRENNMTVPPNVQARVDEADAITFYVLGAQLSRVGNYWTTLPAWPNVTPYPLYLASNGRLLEKPPTAANQSLTFVYDPADPVPSLGGNELALPCGPRDQAAIETRADVLVFTTEPFPAAVAVVGKVTATVFFATDRVDTDVTVKVTDVYPDGRSMLVQDGVVRLRWRLGGLTPVFVTPGEVLEVEVALARTAYILDAGHAVRVAISSSNYPRFSVNPNNGRPINETAPALVARNTVYFDSTRPSHVTFPVVKLAALPANFDP